YPASWGSVAAPAGGVKASGLGHRHGIEGIHQFMHTHTIAEQRLHPIAPSARLDQERFAALMTGSLSVIRALRMRKPRKGCQCREPPSPSSERWSRSDTRSSRFASERDHCFGGDRACASVDAVEALLGHGHGRLGAESSVLDE